MKISRRNTEYLLKVDKFKYLESTIQSHRQCTRELKRIGRVELVDMCQGGFVTERAVRDLL